MTILHLVSPGDGGDGGRVVAALACEGGSPEPGLLSRLMPPSPPMPEMVLAVGMTGPGMPAAGVVSLSGQATATVLEATRLAALCDRWGVRLLHTWGPAAARLASVWRGRQSGWPARWIDSLGLTTWLGGAIGQWGRLGERGVPSGLGGLRAWPLSAAQSLGPLWMASGLPDNWHPGFWSGEAPPDIRAEMAWPPAAWGRVDSRLGGQSLGPTCARPTYAEPDASAHAPVRLVPPPLNLLRQLMANPTARQSGPDESALGADKPDGRAARLAWGIPHDAPVVGVFTALCEPRDLLTAAWTLSVTAQVYPRLWVVRFGDGPQHTRWARLTRSGQLAERVVWAGSDPRQWSTALATLDVGLQTQSHNPASLALVAAAQAGVPLVVSGVATPSPPAAAWEDSNGVMACPPHDARAHAGALHDLLSHPTRAAALGQAGRQRIETLPTHSWPQLYAVIMDSLGGHCPATPPPRANALANAGLP